MSRTQVCIFVLLILVLTCIFGIVLAENALHPETVDRSPSNLPQSIAGTIATYQTVEIKSADATALQGWLFLPNRSHPNFAILLHDAGDTRAGMHRQIRMLLQNDFAVLAPDSRTNLVTYGVKEAEDVHLWADYLFHTQTVQNFYGLGESMGGAVLLQSLPLEPRFQAVVAESPFSNFTAVAYDRVEQNFGSDAWPVRALATPIVTAGLLYAQARYGVNLRAASPLEAVRHSSVPILLIHGLRDGVISPQHSRILTLANPRHITPWFVPRAGHLGAFSADPAVFEERVISFFRNHQH